MHSDSFFTGCRAHNVCQDYARAGKTPSGRVYAIVSDGCSSSPDTDFGARLLTAAAVFSINQFTSIKPEWTIWEASRCRPPYIPVTCLDATLFAAFDNPGGWIDVTGFGDGVVVARRRDGRVDAWSVGFDNNAPAYLSYLLSTARLKTYTDGGYGGRIITLWEDGVPSGPVTPQDDVEFAWGLTIDPKEYDLVMVLSDGVHSFLTDPAKGTPMSVHFLEVVNHLLDIKTFTGEFMVRRAKRFMHNTCQEKGWHNSDDFSVAAIYLGENP